MRSNAVVATPLLQTESRPSDTVGFARRPSRVSLGAQAGLMGGFQLADVMACGRCGARSWAGAFHCHACGGSLTSAGQVVVPPGQPQTPFAPSPPGVPVVPPQFAPPNPPAVAPPGWPVPGAPPPGPFTPYGAPSAQPWYGAAGPYGAPPAGYNPGPPSGTVAARPIGMTILAIVEIAIGLVGLYIAIDLFGLGQLRNQLLGCSARRPGPGNGSGLPCDVRGRLRPRPSVVVNASAGVEASISAQHSPALPHRRLSVCVGRRDDGHRRRSRASVGTRLPEHELRSWALRQISGNALAGPKLAVRRADMKRRRALRPAVSVCREEMGRGSPRIRAS